MAKAPTRGGPEEKSSPTSKHTTDTSPHLFTEDDRIDCAYVEALDVIINPIEQSPYDPLIPSDSSASLAQSSDMMEQCYFPLEWSASVDFDFDVTTKGHLFCLGVCAGGLGNTYRVWRLSNRAAWVYVVYCGEVICVGVACKDRALVRQFVPSKTAVRPHLANDCVESCFALFITLTLIAPKVSSYTCFVVNAIIAIIGNDATSTRVIVVLI